MEFKNDYKDLDKNDPNYFPVFRTSSNYRSFPKKYIELSDEKLVETAGYITAKQRIENMILAGQRLIDFRKNQFDFPEGEIDENFEDPTRDPNFDMADASTLAIENEDRLLEQQSKIDAEKEQKLADKKAQKEADKKELEEFRSKVKKEKSKTDDVK